MVGVAIELVLARQPLFEVCVLGRHRSVVTQAISKRQALLPERALEHNQVQVVGSLRGRWLAEPVHDVRSVLEVAVLVLLQYLNGIARSVESLDARHDVDDGFGE